MQPSADGLSRRESTTVWEKGDVVSWQHRVYEWLKPAHVDPEDKSWKAFWLRLRNRLLHGMTVEIHEVRINIRNKSCYIITTVTTLQWVVHG